MLTLTATAIDKVKEIMAERGEATGGLRIAVNGGGCAGFQYQMSLDKEPNAGDKIIEQGGLRPLEPVLKFAGGLFSRKRP